MEVMELSFRVNVAANVTFFVSDSKGDALLEGVSTCFGERTYKVCVLNTMVYCLEKK